VHVHGVVPWETLPKELETMDVGIVANRANVATELMLPAKLIDYVILDIPAIVPKLPAIQYYFSPDMVSFFEPENVDSMVAATVNLYRDNARRARQRQNAKSFLDKYAWDNRQNALKHLYSNLSGNQPRTVVGAALTPISSPEVTRDSGRGCLKFNKGRWKNCG
jgi:hypothetical protein